MTLATASGQILVGRIRKTNGLFLVWRESPVATQIAIALKKLKKAKKTGKRDDSWAMLWFVTAWHPESEFRMNGRPGQVPSPQW
jgi:hypothetical protein